MTRRIVGACAIVLAAALLAPGMDAAPAVPIPERHPRQSAVQQATVPNLVGRREQDARQLIAEAGLQVGQVRRQPSRASRGEVLEQDPKAGQQVPAGSTVDLVVAAPETAAVPPVVGRTQADAADRLERAGLAPGTVTFEESRSPEGTVLRQQPPAGQIVPAGTAVDMVVARPVTVSVPRLVGRAQDDAIGLVRQAELVPGAVTAEESRRPEGTVLSQQPQAGDTVAIGTQVRLVVARPVTVLVPSLVGRTQLEAGSLLAEAELVPGGVTSAESRRREGTVLSQVPTAGERVVIGTRVNFVLATPVTVKVPSLVGRTRPQAARLLEQAELVVGDVRQMEARRPPGTVLSQQPDAGATVVIGSAVAIVTATPVTTVVPDVVSRSEAEARQRLEKAELVVGTVAAEESRSPVGSVLRQSVAAETRVPVGTAVDLTTAVPVTVLVPDLVGVSQNDARERLAAVELAPGRVGYRESPRIGIVLSQGTAQGTRVPVGTQVAFVVGVVETVPVPELVGLPVEKAREALTGGRLAVGGEEARPTHLEPEGTVLAQDVEAGTRTAIGTPVGLTVAAIEMVAVPGVVGLPHDEAAAALTAAGLTVGTVTPRFSIRAGGTVLAQALQPSQQVPWGTPVAIDEARPRLIWMGPTGGVLLLAGLAGLVLVRKRRRGPEEPPHRADVPPPSSGVVDRAVVDRGSRETSEPAGDIILDERRGRGPGAKPPEEKP